jgi:nicotinamidase-related amidase
VIHVQNNGSIGDPDEPETVGWELAFAHVDGEIVVQKSEPNTFGSNPHLAKALREMGVKRLVVAGMQSEFCIKETCLGALLEGFEVWSHWVLTPPMEHRCQMPLNFRLALKPKWNSLEFR